MSIIQEAWDLLNKIVEESSDNKNIIRINAVVECTDKDYIIEKLPSGNRVGEYDEQTLDDWYDFASTVEGIIDNFCEVVHVSSSNNPDSLSEYIDFYSIDEQGTPKDYLVDLRLSDHSPTKNTQPLRKRKASRINPKFVLKTVTVNDKTFKSYDEAIRYIRKMLTKEFFMSDN